MHTPASMTFLSALLSVADESVDVVILPPSASGGLCDQWQNMCRRKTHKRAQCKQTTYLNRCTVFLFIFVFTIPNIFFIKDHRKIDIKLSDLSAQNDLPLV